MNPEFPNMPNLPTPPLPENPQAEKSSRIKTALVSIWLYLGSQAGFSMVFSAIISLITLIFLSRYPYGLLSFGTETSFQESLTNFIMFVVSIFACVVVCLYAIPKTGVSLKKQLQESRYKKSDLLFGVCAAYGLSIPLGLITTLLSQLLGLFGLSIPEVGMSHASSFAGQFWFFMTAVVAAPICEEVVFRGILLNSLKKYSPCFALVFSSLLFSLAHMNLYQGISVFGIGLVMGFMYLKTGSLQASIFIHFINNLIAVMSEWIPECASIFLSIAILVMAVIGLWFLFQNRATITRLIQDPSAAGLWKIVSGQFLFWSLVFLFCFMSLFSILGFL